MIIAQAKEKVDIECRYIPIGGLVTDNKIYLKEGVDFIDYIREQDAGISVVSFNVDNLIKDIQIIYKQAFQAGYQDAMYKMCH